MNLEMVLESGPAPAVVIMSPPVGTLTTDDLVIVKAQIVDMGKGIGRIEWRVNGATAAVSTRPRGSGGSEYNLS